MGAASSGAESRLLEVMGIFEHGPAVRQMVKHLRRAGISPRQVTILSRHGLEEVAPEPPWQTPVVVLCGIVLGATIAFILAMILGIGTPLFLPFAPSANHTASPFGAALGAHPGHPGQVAPSQAAPAPAPTAATAPSRPGDAAATAPTEDTASQVVSSATAGKAPLIQYGAMGGQSGPGATIGQRPLLDGWAAIAAAPLQKLGAWRQRLGLPADVDQLLLPLCVIVFGGMIGGVYAVLIGVGQSDNAPNEPPTTAPDALDGLLASGLYGGEHLMGPDHSLSLAPRSPSAPKTRAWEASHLLLSSQATPASQAAPDAPPASVLAAGTHDLGDPPASPFAAPSASDDVLLIVHAASAAQAWDTRALFRLHGGQHIVSFQEDPATNEVLGVGITIGGR